MSGSGFATGACILHVVVVVFNVRATKRKKAYNSRYGFAKSVGARNRRKRSSYIRHALAAGLLADVAGIAAAIVICSILYG